MATQPLQIKGIARSKSKLAVEDGQAEDLINLRFKDGSWRTAGDGKRVYSLGDETYQNIYVHTASYRHLLGHNNGNVYWFANIDELGDISPLPNGRVMLIEEIDTSGNIIYTQLGHAIVFITEKSRLTFVYDEIKESYELKEKLEGDMKNSYPVGNVDFRITERTEDGNPVLIHTKTSAKPTTDGQSYTYEEYDRSKIYAKAGYDKIMRKMKEMNSYPGIFIACVAVKLITGKWTWASSPVLINTSLFGNTLSRTKKDGASAFPLEQWESAGSGKYIKHIYRGDVDSPIYVIGDNHLLATSDIDYDQQIKKSQYKNDNTISPRAVNVCDFGKVYSYHTDGDYTTVETTTTVSDFAELPVLFDTYFTPQDYYAQWIVRRETDEHRVFGKLNDLEFRINHLNIEEGGLYSSVGIFITPMLGENGLSFDTNDLSVNGDHTVSFALHGGYNQCGTNIRMNVPAYNTQGITFPYIESNHGLYTTWMPKHLFTKANMENALYSMEHSLFYKIKEYPIERVHKGEWIKVSLDPGVLTNLTQQEQLNIEAFSSSMFVKAKYGYSYNGRLHMADYKTTSRSIWGTDHLFEHDYTNEGRLCSRITNSSKQTNIRDYYNEPPIVKELFDTYNAEYYGLFALNFLKNGNILQDSYSIPTPISDTVTNTTPIILSSFVPYIDSGIEKIESYINLIWIDETSGEEKHRSVVHEYTFTNKMIYYGVKFSMDFEVPLDLNNLHPIYTTYKDKLIKPEDTGTKAIMKEQDVPNGLLVSAVDSPTFFPVDQSYKIGNGRIIAMCSNSIAVGTGQTGAAPLYIFCTDGIYAMFVDQTGEMAYTNARIIARDVCNNAKSVTPIDAGVVFTTDRGLMMIAGEQVQEIGQIAEGDVLNYKTTPWAYKRTGEPIYVGNNMLTQIAKLPDEIVDGVNFLEFLRGSIINYNHNERELMVSNTQYPYTYILDQFGNWSRRDYTADEYVNNFPTSYRVVDGVFYKVDEERDQLAGVSEAPNNLLYLSNVIKLGTPAFKSANRFVVRGKFDTHSEIDIYATLRSEYSKSQSASMNNHWGATNVSMGTKIKDEDGNLIKVEEGMSADVTIKYNGAFVISLGDDGDISTIFNTNKENSLTAKYQIVHVNGTVVFESDTFDSVLNTANRTIAINFNHADDTVTLQSGVYTLKLILVRAELNLDSTAQPVTTEYVMQGFNYLNVVEQKIQRNERIELRKISINAAGGTVESTFEGDSNYECDNDFSQGQKTCRLKRDYNNVIKETFSIIDEHDHVYYSKEFSGIQQNDFSITVPYRGTSSVRLEDGGIYYLVVDRHIDIELERTEQPYHVTSETKNIRPVSGLSEKINVGDGGVIDIDIEDDLLTNSVEFSNEDVKITRTKIELSEELVGGEFVKFSVESPYFVTYKDTIITPRIEVYDETNGVVAGYLEAEEYEGYNNSGSVPAWYRFKFGEQIKTVEVDPTHTYKVRLRMRARFNTDEYRVSQVTLTSESLMVDNVINAEYIKYTNAYSLTENYPRTKIISNTVTSDKVDKISFASTNSIAINNKFRHKGNKTLGCYVLGSYDGTKFALMGGNEKKGKFSDIGCKIERTDIKYLRVALAGHLSGDSRIDFIEIEGEGSNLNTKIR